jgi:hypothetical protein
MTRIITRRLKEDKDGIEGYIEKEQNALAAVKESLDLFALYRDGVTQAMERIPLN